jgi:hypothetical protein
MTYVSSPISMPTEMAITLSVMYTPSHEEITMGNDYLGVPGGIEWFDYPDAAVLFALSVLLNEERFEDFEWLLTPGNGIYSIGVTDWCDLDCAPNEDCPDWPDGAAFYAYVDPDDMNLKYPDMFLTRKEFYGYLRKGIRSFMAQNPMKAAKALPVLDLMDATEDIPGPKPL